MRGKGFKYIHAKLEPGITPAYAGKSVCMNREAGLEKDHPRLCGEKFKVVVFFQHVQGSPPPMRGKGNDQGWTGYRNRITPAYAGKSFRIHLFITCQPGSPPPMRGKVDKSHEKVRAKTDHPRLCGEKFVSRRSKLF